MARKRGEPEARPDDAAELSELPPEQRQIALGVLSVVQRFRYSGPLPMASELEAYEGVLPGAADRIVRMAERQSEHRQRLEDRVIVSGLKSQTLGQWFAFLISMTVVIGGLYLTARGQSLEGMGAVVGAVGTLVGLFLYSKQEQRADLTRKAEPFQGHE